MPNLLDILKMNGADKVAGLIDETTKVHPEMTQVPSRTIKGINYKTVVRTAVNAVAGFRDANDGVDATKGTYENRLIEAFLLEARWAADKALADSYEDGARAYVAIEAEGQMEGQMQGLSKQFYYGTNATFGNAKGFPGLLQGYDATNMVVDAGGTTDNVASSVWFVRLGVKDVIWVWGNNGTIEVTPSLDNALANPVLVTGNNSKQHLAYVQSLFARPGLQVGSTRSICRIKKVTTDNGKGLTDALIFDALGKFPAGRGPNVCFMTQRSLMQLQKSRTSTTSSAVKTAANSDAARMTEYPRTIVGIDGQDIPILVTDAISNIETLAL
jgi:hypothetical protein